MWVYPPNCRTKVGARWSPSFPRQSLARRRARNIVQVHAHALNGSWECYHVVRIGSVAIWGDHGRRRSLHFTTPHFCLKKGWVYPLIVHFPKTRRSELGLLVTGACFSLCEYVCVFSSHPFWTSSSLDVPAGVTQEEGHTGFLIHLPSAVRALIFVARRIQPFLSLVDREVEFCVLTN